MKIYMCVKSKVEKEKCLSFIIWLFSLLSMLFQKRQLAAASNQYNLNDKIFCELFPEAVQVSRFSLLLSGGLILIG